MKQRQQKELAESIIGKITKELENPRTLQQILQQSVADVESKFELKNGLQDAPVLNCPYRNRFLESPIDRLRCVTQNVHCVRSFILKLS